MVNGTYSQPTRARIDRYDVIAELGRGGMGVVYHAYEPTLDRAVALKILSPDLATRPGFVERLHREAVNTARLRHPHIALLYEFGQDEGDAFLAMEYIAGPSLREMLEAGALPPERALHIVEQIAGALEYAHSMGITHRDVKPSNILIGPNDHAVLIDFGLAQMAEDPLLTGDTALLGTPHYMAPEQARGDNVDARSDQYALAAVTYEMLTGVPLFHGRTASAVLHAHIYEQPPAPTERCPALPEAINSVLLRALAKSPAARYPSLSEFTAELRAAFTAPRKPQRRRMSRRLATGAIIVALIATLGLGIVLARSGVQRANADGVTPPGHGVPIPTRVVWFYEPGFAGGPTPAITANTLVFGTLDGSVIALNATDGNLRWKKDSGTSLYGAPGAGAGQIFVGDANGNVFCLDPASGAIIWQQRVIGAVQQAPLRSNDRLIVTTVKGYLYVLQAGSGAIIWGRQVSEDMQAPSVGAGTIFVSVGRSLLALDWNSGATAWRYEAESEVTTQPVVAGNMVLIGTERGMLRGISIADGQERWRYQARGPLSGAPTVGGETIYFGDESGMMSAIGFDGQDIWHFPASTSITAAPLLADGKLFFGTSGGSMYTLDARSGRPLATMQLEGSVNAAPVLGADFVYIRAKRVYALGS